MSPFENEKLLLPAFPRTAHLPYQANATQNDIIASEAEASVVFCSPVNIEEKIDGASVGMALWEGDPIIRNRDHILRKGYLKDTPAKVQFRPLWGWFYDHKENFEALGGEFSVYGEWCLAQHGLWYDKLPDWFIAYDVYDQRAERFVAPTVARTMLQNAGFSVPRLFCCGKPDDLTPDRLAEWASSRGRWTHDEEPIEGLYIKLYDKLYVTSRFKVVRPGFVPGSLWNKNKITKNGLLSKKETTI